VSNPAIPAITAVGGLLHNLRTEQAKTMTDDWLSIARASDLEEVRERILTGYRSGKPFTPYLPTIEMPAGIERVLDFGCGLGRNFPYLATIAGEVVGFDLPPMIERCREVAAGRPIRLTSDWEDIRRCRFDVIVATLVLQHLEPATCRAYLEDFARIAPAVYVLTRARSDFDANVLDGIAESGLFDPSPCVEVEHDPGTHQLRIIGKGELEQVRRGADNGHYEMLLHSKGTRT
jgi:SAM-dependent methyltransferase